MLPIERIESRSEPDRAYAVKERTGSRLSRQGTHRIAPPWVEAGHPRAGQVVTECLSCNEMSQGECLTCPWVTGTVSGNEA